MQLQSLLSFLGSLHPTLEGNAGRGADAQKDSSGFGSMLSAAFASASNQSTTADSAGSAAVTEAGEAVEAMADAEADVAATTSDDLNIDGVVSEAAAGSSARDAAKRSTNSVVSVSEGDAGAISGDDAGTRSAGDAEAASAGDASAASVGDASDHPADGIDVKASASAKKLNAEDVRADTSAIEIENAAGSDLRSAADKEAAAAPKAATGPDAAKASNGTNDSAHVSPVPGGSGRSVTKGSKFTGPDSGAVGAVSPSEPKIGSTTASTDPRSSAGQSAPGGRVDANFTPAQETQNAGQTKASALGDQHAPSARGSELTEDASKPSGNRLAIENDLQAANIDSDGVLDGPSGRAVVHEAGTKPAGGPQPSLTASIGQDSPLATSTDISARAATAEGGHPTATSSDSDRSVTARPPSSEQVRVTDLERASHRLPVEHMRVWQEGSTTARADGDAAAATKPSTQVTSNTAVLEMDTQTAAATADQRAPAGSDVIKNVADGASSPLPAPDETLDPDIRTENDRPESRSRALAKDGGPGTAMQGETGAGHDFGSGSQNMTTGGFKLEEKGLAPHTGDFDVSLQDEGAVLDAEQSVDAPVEATAEELAIASEKASTPASLASIDSTRRTGRPLHPGNAAWLNSLLSDRLGTLSLDEGWKVLEMQLEEGQGTMTVRARRDEDKVSIAVTFSDPQMRALAAENADRLRETMREQYETMVDFSLSSDSADESPQQRGNGQRGRDASPSHAPPAEAVSLTERASVTRAALAGARNEWIG